MLPLPNDKFWTNKFVKTMLPTKRQIFSRTGQTAVTPNGVYTKDESVHLGRTQTESMNEFVKMVESIEMPKLDE